MEVTIDLDVITSELDKLKDSKEKLKFELKQIEKQIEQRELKLEALLDKMQVNEMVFQNYTFGIKITERNAFDQKLFSSNNPELFEKYKKNKEIKSFYFKIN